MPREFDSFIIVPEFAEKPIMHYDDYIGKKTEDYPEMALLQFKSIIASFIHDATEKEEKTIAFFETPNTNIKAHFQKKLKTIDKTLKINTNIFLDTISILPEENNNYHLAKLTFIANNKKTCIYSYGPEVIKIEN